MNDVSPKRSKHWPAGKAFCWSMMKTGKMRAICFFRCEEDETPDGFDGPGCSNIIYLYIEQETASRLDLTPMTMQNTSRHKTVFTVSIKAEPRARQMLVHRPDQDDHFYAGETSRSEPSVTCFPSCRTGKRFFPAWSYGKKRRSDETGESSAFRRIVRTDE